MHLSPPRAKPSVALSETVFVSPAASADMVILTTYRHDGRVFLRLELPGELAAAIVPRLERYTRRYDDSRPPLRRLK